MPSTSLPAAQPFGARLAGALLSLGVAWIHVKDQGGFPGSKTPTYVGVGYYFLEAAAVLVALMLVVANGRTAVRTWVLAAAVAFGPIVGFLLSRGPGLPGYTDDRGNWTETLGVVSLVVEAALLLLSTTVLVRSRQAVLTSA